MTIILEDDNGGRVSLSTLALPAIVADTEKAVVAHVKSNIILTVDILIDLLIIAKAEMEIQK